MKNLAINGGTPVTTTPFPSWPYWDEKEEKKIIEVLEAGQWGTLGNEAVDFAKRFAGYLGAKYAIAVNTGTQALELMMRGAGIGRGDEVIVPAYTFVATVSAVAYIGAMPVFADIDVETGNLSAESVRACITDKTKAILAVHIAGRPCDMDALNRVAKENNLLLFEDCAHAHGSEWKGVKCGALADAAAFSFQASKVLTGGEGGMIVTSDDGIYAGCWHYHNSGRALKGVGNQSLGGEVLMGTNGRMAEWEAGILSVQMDRLDDQCAKRMKNQQYVTERIKNQSGIVVAPADERITGFSGFLYTFRYTGNRNAFVKALAAEGIPCSTGYPALHRMGMLTEPAFEKFTGRRYVKEAILPNTDRLIHEAVWIPGSVFLADEEDVEKVATAIEKVARAIAGDSLEGLNTK